MAEYIEREATVKLLRRLGSRDYRREKGSIQEAIKMVSFPEYTPSADVTPVRHGRWILEAHDERVNYRWNVTAECSECCDEQKEIWAGFFPNVPDWLARDTALIDAKSVKLNNYCPNCGAKMDGGDNNSDICSKTI